jgi:glutathione synthase/RimK-type ligase-like ATP-grasp enzyme
MTILIVVSDAADWEVEIPGTRVVTARDYLTSTRYTTNGRAPVFNLCRSFRYQKFGYYVSLVADARGHRPFPTPSTIQALKSRTILNAAAAEMSDVIQQSLKPLASREFTVTAYFGRNIADRHARLAMALFRAFPAPLLRGYFKRTRAGQWTLENLEPMSPTDVPAEHWDFLSEVAEDYFKRRHALKTSRKAAAYDLAILANPDESDPPSNPRAIQKFLAAGRSLGFDVEVIGRNDYHRIMEFDALFIRETTQVNHHTFRFAQKAAFAGMVVIDDPVSILRCTNKVYLAELLARRGIATPKTMILHRGNASDAPDELGLPCILKQPDSSFSQGVSKADTREEYERAAADLLARSDLVIAQEFAHTEFDWRIGILGRRPLYACKYFMAHQHWQVVRREGGGKKEGNSECVPLDRVPRRVVSAAVKAANQIGDGLYGVDLKETRGRALVIEVNDNPSLDAGCEDELLGDALYRQIVRHFRDLLDAKRNRA